MNWNRSLLLACALAQLIALRCAAFPGSAKDIPSSGFSPESNGVWMVVDGVKTPAIIGMVYQNTEGSKHVRAYEYGSSLHSLYSDLDDESNGGRAQGEELSQMAIRAIRVYELPVNDPSDVEQTKGIFRRLHSKYHIKVLVGDYAGLNMGMDFHSTGDRTKLRVHLQKLVATYANEEWLLGWQLGNENNYHIQNGILGDEINLNPAEYFSFMDELAGVMKREIGDRTKTQFVSLGEGDLKEPEAVLIGNMKNIDAVGINCYRKDPYAFEQVIDLAASQIHKPIYFAEVGLPAKDAASATQRDNYLESVCTLVFSHVAGGIHSGTVVGVFLHEATDEAWKVSDRNKEEDAHYGILGKPDQPKLAYFLKRYRDFFTYVLPTNNAPDTLIESAWQCLEGPYARQYGRDYGYSMTYANLAITNYQQPAQAQEKEMAAKPLLERKFSPEKSDGKYWALDTVGTGYFILGDAWMLLSFDHKGMEVPVTPWQKFFKWADVPPAEITARNGVQINPTNSAACRYYAREVFATLNQQFPHARLRESNGKFVELDRAVQTRFPELSPPYISFTWKNGVIFVGSCMFVILGAASIARWRENRSPLRTKAVMGPGTRTVFLLALAFNLTCLFWFGTWWFHPIRLEYFTVQPILFWVLSAVGIIGALFYFYVWFIFWNLRQPVPMKAVAGHRVAIVTTRVASEPIESIEATLKKMAEVTYPHDSYLLDEENSEAAKAVCEKYNVIHASRRGKANYNQSSGKFQARTKGGNLNFWLYEFGANYEFVSFIDPDHAPRPEFLDKVLGYFEVPTVSFVQAPQVFYNAAASWIARGAAEQSYFFNGPIQMGLFGLGACVVNGSHCTYRISDLMSLRGEGYAVHDADDILTSMRIHAIRKTGVYLPEVLAEGLAPDNWDEFSKQQRRWAGSMFHLLFHYYIPELWRLPWRCKLVYLAFTTFYFRGVAFVGLLIMPFVSTITGNPPVNSNVAAFCCRYIPFLFVHYGILLFLGQNFLISQGCKRGFWYRGGLLWVAMWWDHTCALLKSIRGKKVKDRMVAAKWRNTAPSPWRAVRPHIVLTLAAMGVFTWACLRPDRRETVWGSLIFLALIVVSQSLIIFKIVRANVTVPQAVPLAPEQTVDSQSKNLVTTT